MKKVFWAFGTRPEAIKMAPLVHRLVAKRESFNLKVYTTAQYRQMLDQVLKILGTVPEIDFKVMKRGQDLSDARRRL